MFQKAGYNLISSGRKVKISVEFNNNTVHFEIEHYKPIKHIKEKSIKVFYPLSSEIRLTYNNKDLTNYENMAIGDFFKNKQNIHIKLYQIVNFNQKENDLNYASLSNSPNVDLKSYAGNVVLCSCGKDYANYYCRNDKQFLCKSCRINEPHQSHLSSKFDVESVHDSIRYYIKSLNSELNILNSNCKATIEKMRNSKLLDPQSRKEMILRKLEDIERKHHEVLEAAPKLDDVNYNQIDELGMRMNSCQEDLNNIIEIVGSVYSQSKTTAFSKTSAFYDLVNEKEYEITDITEKLINYRINFEIQKKFDDMYKLIEKALDSVYYSDYSIESLVGENTYSNLIRLRNSRIYQNNLNEVSTLKEEKTDFQKKPENTKMNKDESMVDVSNELEKKKLGPIKEKKYFKMENNQSKINFEEPVVDSPGRLTKKKSMGTKHPKDYLKNNNNTDNVVEDKKKDESPQNLKKKEINDLNDLLEEDNQTNNQTKKQEPQEIKNDQINEILSPELDQDKIQVEENSKENLDELVIQE